jgi:hypothetical protein
MTSYVDKVSTAETQTYTNYLYLQSLLVYKTLDSVTPAC